MRTSFDSLHMGRSSIDLYSNDIGAPFPEITQFAAYVGGSPTNICVGMRRLGRQSNLLTAVGNDPVGDFILAFLEREGIDPRYIARKPGRRTSAVVLGIEPPDRFPLVYYRDNCADIEMTIDDALAAPLGSCRMFQFAGTNLSRDPSRSATLFAAEGARRSGAEVVLDLDFRPDQWHDPRAFGVAVLSSLRLVDIVIGTEDEINAVALAGASAMRLTHSQVSDTRVTGDTERIIADLLSMGPKVVVRKRGEEGAAVYIRETEQPNRRIDVPGFPVQVANILGAGDAFAAGFLFGRLTGRDWYESGRLGNACGAIVVTSHGCANFMPTNMELDAFLDSRGGI